MEILKNKWVHSALVIVMVFLIINSNQDGKRAIKYLHNTEQLKKDISYTLSKTKEVIAVSKMTQEEIAEYYMKKQREQEEAEKKSLEEETKKEDSDENQNQNDKINENLEGIQQLSMLMKPNEVDNPTKEERPKEINQGIEFLSEEEKLFDRVYIEKTYGPLKDIGNRMIECGDYVNLEYMVYEDDKPMFNKKMQIYLLIGSDIISGMEEVVNGMYLNQNKKIDIATRENYSKSGEYIESKKIIQEIHILSIEEVKRKELLNCN
ncbi:hypothetical protein ACFL0U_02135 [Pseudomonadota bacterium]